MARAWISFESLRRVMVMLTILGLGLSTLGASRYKAACCKNPEPVAKQCCEKHKSQEKQEPVKKTVHARVRCAVLPGGGAAGRRE
jgi:hypothetical protein